MNRTFPRSKFRRASAISNRWRGKVSEINSIAREQRSLLLFFVGRELLQIETPEHFDFAVDRAAELLKRGEVVAVPTETVYGLAANALDEAAVRRIYEVK